MSRSLPLRKDPMYVNVDLKCPQDGEWFAITRVDDAGGVLPVGYMSREDFDALAPELERRMGPCNFDLVKATEIPDGE